MSYAAIVADAKRAADDWCFAGNVPYSPWLDRQFSISGLPSEERPYWTRLVLVFIQLSRKPSEAIADELHQSIANIAENYYRNEWR